LDDIGKGNKSRISTPDAISVTMALVDMNR
jgi:hypothetical protein